MMKGTLFLFLLVAVPLVHSFRQHGPPRPPPDSDSSDSSMSSEEDSGSMEKPVEPAKKRIQPEDFVNQQKKQFPSQQQINEKKNRFFDRPSSDELEAYDDKVAKQNKNGMKPKNGPRIIEEQPMPLIDTPDRPEVIRPKPKGTMDEFDEKTFLATLGQIYLEKMDSESEERFPGPMGPGPVGPIPAGPPMDMDYFFVPYDDDVPKQANNNGNNNVHVNVNHVQVNSNVIHAPAKEDKDKKDRPVHEEPVPYMPVYHEPVTSSKYLYLNFNMTDAVILAVLCAAFVFATKKAYQRCFPKKQVSSVPPQLPTTLPPTYSPSHIVVETTSKKVPQ